MDMVPMILLIAAILAIVYLYEVSESRYELIKKQDKCIEEQLHRIDKEQTRAICAEHNYEMLGSSYKRLSDELTKSTEKINRIRELLN